MLIPSIFADSVVHAPATTSSQSVPQLIVFVGFLFLFYFLVWQPQTKRQREKQSLLASLRVGDVVYTTGGMVGKIVALHHDFFELKVASNTHLYIQKESVTELLPKGSLKALGF